MPAASHYSSVDLDRLVVLSFLDHTLPVAVVVVVDAFEVEHDGIRVQWVAGVRLNYFAFAGYSGKTGRDWMQEE